MTWALFVGLAWATLTLPAAIVVGLTLRAADPRGVRTLPDDDSWTDQVSDFLKDVSSPQAGLGPTPEGVGPSS